mmetsp:Transcript_533/g.653  ORF Transcript_533/g.653 Transcript_533/m.653 type:complete len:92 (+) Transcript_533:171-446(+)
MKYFNTQSVLSIKVSRLFVRMSLFSIPCTQSYTAEHTLYHSCERYFFYLLTSVQDLLLTCIWIVLEWLFFFFLPSFSTEGFSGQKEKAKKL